MELLNYKDVNIGVVAYWVLDEIFGGTFQGLDLTHWDHFLNKFYELSVWGQSFLLWKLSLLYSSKDSSNVPDKFMLLVSHISHIF